MTVELSSPAPAAALLRPLMTLSLTVAKPLDAGGPLGAAQRFAAITGGHFNGEGLSGTVVPGGADWQTLRSDGATLIDARILLTTDDGAQIAMAYSGIRHGPDHVMARLARGEAVDPSTYYFRIVPAFSTSAPAYEWLNRVVAVGMGDRQPAGPVYQLYALV